MSKTGNCDSQLMAESLPVLLCKMSETSAELLGTGPSCATNSQQETIIIDDCVMSISSHAIAATSLPPEVWARVALWLFPKEFALLKQCTHSMFLKSEEILLWYHFCEQEGFVRSPEFSADECPRDMFWTGPAVTWSQCFRQNAFAQFGDTVFAFVRIRDKDVCVPVLTDDGSGSNDSRTRDWLFQRGWRSLDALSRTMCCMLEPCSMPLRFRELILDRPGMLIRYTSVHSQPSAVSTMVEWPVGKSGTGEFVWKMPPHTLDESRVDPPTMYFGPHVHGRDFGSLVELSLHEKEGEHMGSLAQAAPVPRWIHIGGPTGPLTVKDLCISLKAHIGALGFDCTREVLPASQRAWVVEETMMPDTALLDICWLHGERLRMREVGVPRRLCQKFRCELSEQGQDDECMEKVVLYQRETARRRKPLCCTGLHAKLAELAVAQPNQISTGIGVGLDSMSTDSVVVQCQGDTLASELGGRQYAEGHEHADHMHQQHLNAVDDFQQLPHERRLVLASSGARQFEFHPMRPDILLAGHKDGMISIINHEIDRTTHKLKLDSKPIIGLSWLHTHPQWAVCGVSREGSVCLMNYQEERSGLIEHVCLESFENLTSLSVNCTDELFVTSGFSVDLGLYDLLTGKKVTTFHGMHRHFINHCRFAHRSPHIFATASFDHTCKLWDLREPLMASKPVRLFETESLNMMCCFSPDDENVLCSGVDDALRQFNLGKDTSCHSSSFRLPAAKSATNYRRSSYLMDGNLIATACTEEIQVRICLASQPYQHLGIVDFKGMLGKPMCWPQSDSNVAYHQESASPLAPSLQEPSRQKSSSDEHVQSLRNHPFDPMSVGALLSTSDADPESMIAIFRLGKM